MTLGAWGVLTVALLWVLAAVGWYLLARLWLRELFVPGAVSTTVFAVLLATLWAVLLGWGMLFWSLYHYRRYYRHNRRRLLPPALRAPCLPRQELKLVPPCPSPSVPPSYTDERTAAAFFSRAVRLAKRGESHQAIELLRQALQAENIPRLLRAAILFRLGDLYARAGEKGLARTCFILAQTERRRA
ncbi:hypothetical protein [Ammonifex degensii]|uniref:hypothetical protein n=1 Tax=Ammonifex degensii TaxID=42838 RepID=UPI0012E9CD3C|nr:hypothetical protein [Ammonifex degensii]